MVSFIIYTIVVASHAVSKQENRKAFSNVLRLLIIAVQGSTEFYNASTISYIETEINKMAS